MRPLAFRPAVDRLEPLTLLSGAGSSLAYTLTTDKPVYQVGEPVHMTLTETNTSDHDVQFGDGPSLDGFSVTQNGATVWVSNGGFQPFIIVEYNLHPGESYTLQATWDGHPNPDSLLNGGESPATPTGTFQVHNQVDPQDTATFAIQTQPAPTPLAYTLTTDKPVYQVGEPVHMTLTETNTSDHDVQFGDGPSGDGFSVTRNGATVWISNQGPQPQFLRLVDLHPGESYTLRATWDGHPNADNPLGGESPATPTGTFEVHSQVDQKDTVTIAIQSQPTPTPTPTPIAQPLAVSVTTNRASYRRGRPVVVTLTETNTSDHDVPVLTGGRILSGSASGPGGPVWQFRDTRALPTGIGVLHAHQSRRLRFVWNGRPDLPGARVVPGSYSILAGVDNVSGSAAFRITR